MKRKPPRKHIAKGSWVDYPDGRRIWFRSLLERRHAEMLEMQRRAGLIRSWSHEAMRWHFPDQKSGSVSYTADFTVIKPIEVPMGLPFRASRIVDVEEHIECKGHWTPKDRQKLIKMARHYPEVVITIVGAPLDAKSAARVEATRAKALADRAKAKAERPVPHGVKILQSGMPAVPMQIGRNHVAGGYLDVAWSETEANTLTTRFVPGEIRAVDVMKVKRAKAEQKVGA